MVRLIKHPIEHSRVVRDANGMLDNKVEHHAACVGDPATGSAAPIRYSQTLVFELDKAPKFPANLHWI